MGGSSKEAGAGDTSLVFQWRLLCMEATNCNIGQAHLVTTLDIMSGLTGGAMLVCPQTVASRFGGRVSCGHEVSHG
jgi:hypothetical protein